MGRGSLAAKCLQPTGAARVCRCIPVPGLSLPRRCAPATLEPGRGVSAGSCDPGVAWPLPSPLLGLPWC